MEMGPGDSPPLPAGATLSSVSGGSGGPRRRKRLPSPGSVGSLSGVVNSIAVLRAAREYWWAPQLLSRKFPGEGLPGTLFLGGSFPENPIGSPWVGLCPRARPAHCGPALTRGSSADFPPPTALQHSPPMRSEGYSPSKFILSLDWPLPPPQSPLEFFLFSFLANFPWLQSPAHNSLYKLRSWAPRVVSAS